MIGSARWVYSILMMQSVAWRLGLIPWTIRPAMAEIFLMNIHQVELTLLPMKRMTKIVILEEGSMSPSRVIFQITKLKGELMVDLLIILTTQLIQKFLIAGTDASVNEMVKNLIVLD